MAAKCYIRSTNLKAHAHRAVMYCHGLGATIIIVNIFSNFHLTTLVFLFSKSYFMEMEYIQFIADLKRNIIQSRYIAARLANKEQLLLYFRTGKMLAEKIAAEKWGMKIMEQIATDLQKQLPD